MTTPAVAATLILLAIIAALSIKYRRKQSQTGDNYDAANLIEAIDALAELAEQLENADRMLADLNACNPRSLLRGFRAQWQGIDGKSRHIDFLADGRNGATAGLRQAASEQREEINAEIIDTVRAMSAALDSGLAPALTVDVVENTVDETKYGAAPGEW
jgi:pilus assembly protein TadC